MVLGAISTILDYILLGCIFITFWIGVCTLRYYLEHKEVVIWYLERYL